MKVTEAEWLACADPKPMLGHLRRMVRGGFGAEPVPPSDRKFELWVEACRGVVDAAMSANTKQWDPRRPTDYSTTCWAEGLGWTRECPLPLRAALLREIFGNPFRPVVLQRDWYKSVEKHALIMSAAKFYGWSNRDIDEQLVKEPILTWNDGCVPKLARAVFDGRRFDDLPILADALEESGCQDRQILDHCRGVERCDCPCGLGKVTLRYAEEHRLCCLRCGGTGRVPPGCGHVRGCWVLDLILSQD
jgi:hypothetical protein